MESLLTLLSVLIPMFAGFFIVLPARYLAWIDKILACLVNLILLLIGISLAQVENLGSHLDTVLGSVLLLFACVIGMNLLVLAWFDRQTPQHLGGEKGKATVSLADSIKQPAYVAVGFVLGRILPESCLPSESLGMYCLMLLVLLIGIQLRGSGIRLREVLLDKKGVQTALLMMLSSLVGGLLFAALMPEVSWLKGMAMASGFGWYSLSGLVMTEAYGAVWGSIMLLNDLGRELFALAFIPMLMKRYPCAAVGVGGATSLDFTLPVLQASGGIRIVPTAVSFGFIVNVAAPFLMVAFSSFD